MAWVTHDFHTHWPARGRDLDWSGGAPGLLLGHAPDVGRCGRVGALRGGPGYRARRRAVDLAGAADSAQYRSLTAHRSAALGSAPLRRARGDARCLVAALRAGTERARGGLASHPSGVDISGRQRRVLQLRSAAAASVLLVHGAAAVVDARPRSGGAGSRSPLAERAVGFAGGAAGVRHRPRVVRGPADGARLLRDRRRDAGICQRGGARGQRCACRAPLRRLNLVRAEAVAQTFGCGRRAQPESCSASVCSPRPTSSPPSCR